MTKREITRHVPFRCPKCGEPMKVAETRERQGGIWRRRKCPNKHAQTYTIEVVEPVAA